MVDANRGRSRSRDSLEPEQDVATTSHSNKKKKDHQRPKSVHESVGYDRVEVSEVSKSADPKLPPVHHKEVYYMEEILKEENGASVRGSEVGVEDFHDEDDEDEIGHDDVRFSPEKEQALQTLDDVILAAEASMSELNIFFGQFRANYFVALLSLENNFVKSQDVSLFFYRFH